MSPDGLTIATFRYKEKHHEEMQVAWDLLDSDKDGFITATELQDMLLRIGRRLAPWELREMMEQADANHDNVISFDEFSKCYGTLGWEKTKDLGRVLKELETVWSMLDANTDASVGTSEIVQLFAQLGIEIPLTEAEEILKAADEDYDGTVTFKEFIVAYHSEKWAKFRHVGAVHRRLTVMKAKREDMYIEWAMAESGGSTDPNSGDPRPLYDENTQRDKLMIRAALYRNVEVKVAIGRLWNSLEHWREGKEHIEKDLFLTYYTKIAEVVNKDAFCPQKAQEHAEAHWEESKQKVRVYAPLCPYILLL